MPATTLWSNKTGLIELLGLFCNRSLNFCQEKFESSGSGPSFLKKSMLAISRVAIASPSQIFSDHWKKAYSNH